MSSPTKTVFITGATSGIGFACAHIFAKNSHNLILTGRRENRLDDLKNDLISKYNINILTLAFDVKNKHALDQFQSQIESFCSKKIDILINNAGLALGKDNFEKALIEDWDTILDTNVKGLYYVTKKLLPFIINSDSRHIINISSIAGLETYENGNAYCASKAAVNALSEAMRIDLLKHKIKVTAICPGAVNTEFSTIRFKGDKDKAEQTYKGFKPLTAYDIAEVILFCANLPVHVSINQLTITPTAQANSFYTHKN